MYEFLTAFHSILRYLLLILLVGTTIRSLTAWSTGGHYYRSDERAVVFTVICTHLQLLIGLSLLFLSPKVAFSDLGTVMKDPGLRFFTVEHGSLMLLAILLITIGRSKAKRAYSEISKHKRIGIFFLIALLLIFFAIPWPFFSFSPNGTWLF
ncbi:MAG: hypothetical protein ABEH38_04875 [Flavobacteriales bacterium]